MRAETRVADASDRGDEQPPRPMPRRWDVDQHRVSLLAIVVATSPRRGPASSSPSTNFANIAVPRPSCWSWRSARPSSSSRRDRPVGRLGAGAGRRRGRGVMSGQRRAHAGLGDLGSVRSRWRAARPGARSRASSVAKRKMPPLIVDPRLDSGSAAGPRRADHRRQRPARAVPNSLVNSIGVGASAGMQWLVIIAAWSRCCSASSWPSPGSAGTPTRSAPTRAAPGGRHQRSTGT